MGLRIKGEIAPPSAPPAPTAKRRISAEGMKRIIAATKKRWRLKRADEKTALARKAAARNVGVKKAVVKAPAAKAAKRIAPVKNSAAKSPAPARAATPAPGQAAG